MDCQRVTLKMFHYRCRACNEDVKLHHLICAKCGVVKGTFQISTADDAPTVRCARCDSVLGQHPLPDSCNSGHRGSLGWANESEWLQPDLSPTESLQEDVWVSGDFVGSFQGGPQLTATGTVPHDRRRYSISELDQARLSNLKIVAGPPLKLNDREIPPLRLSSVAPVLVQIPEADQDKSAAYSVSLADFRLHDWRDLTLGEVSEFFGKKAAGVVSGRAYGVLRRDPNLKPQRADNLPPPMPEDFGSEPYLSPEGPNTAGTFTTAPIGVGHNPSPLGPLDTGWFAPCLGCSLLLQAFLAGVIWLFCNWKHALIFFALAFLTCRLAKFARERGWAVRSQVLRIVLFALLATLVVGGVLFEAYSLAFSQDCALFSDWPIYLIGGALILTAFVDYCWLKLLMIAVWFTTTLIWCSANGAECNPQRDTRRIDVLVHEIKINIENIFHPDTDSIIVNDMTDDPTNPDNNRKISIDEVIKRPELLDKCGNSIYLPGAALFPANASDIEPRAELELRKLAAVVQRASARMIIITGHADKSGDDTDIGYVYNIELSYNRAQKVAEWLTANAGVDASKIEVRGAGTGMPITSEASNRHLNRRVEVQLECPRQTKK